MGVKHARGTGEFTRLAADARLACAGAQLSAGAAAISGSRRARARGRRERARGAATAYGCEGGCQRACDAHARTLPEKC
jgi:hypothetical protein